MGWSDAELDSITIPSDAADDETRIFVGSGDPVANDATVSAGITFYGGMGGSAGLPQPTNQAFVLGVGPQPGGDSAAFKLTSEHLTTNVTHTLLEVDMFGDNQEDILIGDSQLDSLTIGGLTAGYGLVTIGNCSSVVGPFAAETDFITIPSATYRAGQVYEVEIDGLFQTNGANTIGGFNLRKTLAGLKLSEYGRWPATVAGVAYAVHGKRLFRCGANDVTTTLVITTYPSGGFTVTPTFLADTPFTAEVRHKGPYTVYNATGLVLPVLV